MEPQVPFLVLKKHPFSPSPGRTGALRTGLDFFLILPMAMPAVTSTMPATPMAVIHLTDDVGYEADEIYIEAGYEEFCSWKQEDNRHRYLAECRDEILILSSDVQVSEGGQLIDTVVDDKISIEEDYAEQDERERFRSIIRSLEPEERELLNVMYLSGRVRTEQETANELGVSRDMIKRRKKKLFSKIQKLLRPKF